MNKKEISLYIPCYNAEETIQSCLDAVLKQSFPIEKIVVIDDGSTDKTVALATHPLVKVIRNTHKGLASARNTAIKNIDTEFVASVDADCIPEPDWLEKLMKRFNSKKVAGVGGKLIESYSSTVFDIWRSVHMKQYWQEHTKPVFLFGSNTLFRKEALEKSGLYNENLKNNYEDVDISEQLKKNGYNLVYEPEAVVDHIKTDCLYSILDTYWNWNIGYYLKKKYYTNQKDINFKVKDNFGLAFRYIEEDISSRRYQLIYLNFLLSFHHSLRDLEYFISQGKTKESNPPKSISSWLSFLDLVFLNHFDISKENLSTFINREDAFLQNFFAVNLIVAKCLKEYFGSKSFHKILYKHLLLSVCKIKDNYLLDRLLNVIESNEDWDWLFEKRQQNLNSEFLETISYSFRKLLKDLRVSFPKIIQMVEISADKIDKIAYS